MKYTALVSRSLVLMFLLLATGVVVAGDPVKGRALYEVRCAGCHGTNGQPQVGAIPNFKMGQGLMKPNHQLLSFVKTGRGVMPGFKGVLTDTEILDIIAHIRTFF